MKNNLFLIYGLDEFLIELELQKILKRVDPINTVKYDLDNHFIEKVIEDACTISLFSQQKTIIVKNSNLFTSKKNEIEQNLKTLESYLNNPNPGTIIIFIIKTEKLDERKKVCKLIREKGTLIKIETPKNLTKFIINLFGDYKINSKDINLLIELVGENLGILNQEIIKLKNYKDEDYNITTNDIIEVVTRNMQPDIYLFIDCIINKDLKRGLQLYNDLLIFKEEPVAIISLLANKFRTMIQTKLLSNKGYSIDKIASELDSHPYPIKLALEKGRGYDNKVLLDYLEKLAELDFNIKSGLIDKNLGLELFILNFHK